MNPVSPLFEKIDSSIEKKLDLIESSYVRYAVRAMLACLFLTLGTAIAFAVAMNGDKLVPGLVNSYCLHVQLVTGYDFVYER